MSLAYLTRALEPRSGRRLERHRLADRARHLPGHAAVRPQARRRRQRARPLSRHRSAVRAERRHLRRRPHLHLPPAQGRQVPAAGESRGHGPGLQVQLRAHDELAARPGDVVLHGRRRRRRVHGQEGPGDQRLQGRRRLHRRDHAQDAGPLVPQRVHDGVLRRRPQGVGREVGQAVQPPPAGHRPLHLRAVVAGPRDRAHPQPLLLGGGQAVSRHDRLPALVLAADRPAQAAERRDRRPRRRRAAGRRPARHGRPAVEGARLHPAADRHQLHVHERRDEAVRRRQGAPGAQLGHQPRQARQAAGRSGHVAVAVLPQGHARPRRRQGLLRLRPGQSQAAARRRRLPGRVQDDALHRQRRPQPQALAVGAGRPRRRGRRRPASRR